MTAPPNHRGTFVPVDEFHPNGSVATDIPPVAPARSPSRTRAPLSRVGELWIAAVAFAAILLVLLIFVLENGQRAEVSFFGAHGHLPMGVALLLAAVCGILLVALPGSARILQLRLQQRGHRRAAPGPTATATGAPVEGAAGSGTNR
jgi:uncharacterized integral membrane protein